MTGSMMLFFAISFGICCVTLVLASPMILGPSRAEQRMHDVVTSNRPDTRKVSGGERFQDRLLAVAHLVRTRLGMAKSPKLMKRFEEAGLRSKSVADVFFAAQLLSPLLGVFLGSFIPFNPGFMMFALGIGGFMAPDMWLTYMCGRRKKTLRRSIPDAIDLLVICVEAGLGMDQAVLRVNDELATSHHEISGELKQVTMEQRAGKPRLEAWQSLADRTNVEEFITFVGMLTQTERFGTPVSKALSRFSEELRDKRRQHAEQAAAKTKVKIIFPLVLFIFPCIFIVLLAPAVISIAAGFKGIGN